jgi:hypothetical protein
MIPGHSLPVSVDVELEFNDWKTTAGHVEEDRALWLTFISEPNPHYSTHRVEITEEIHYKLDSAKKQAYKIQD